MKKLAISAPHPITYPPPLTRISEDVCPGVSGPATLVCSPLSALLVPQTNVSPPDLFIHPGHRPDTVRFNSDLLLHRVGFESDFPL